MECNIVNIESIKPSYNTYKELVQREKGNYQKLKYVFRKRYSETMQQIYKRMTMPKCGFNKVALQLYWNHTLAWMFSSKFAAYFQNTFSQEHLWTTASIVRSSRTQMIFKIGVFKISQYLWENTCINKVAGLKTCNFIKRRLQHWWFPVNIAKFLRKPTFIEQVWWLLLPCQMHLAFVFPPLQGLILYHLEDQTFSPFSKYWLLSNGLVF